MLGKSSILAFWDSCMRSLQMQRHRCIPFWGLLLFGVKVAKICLSEPVCFQCHLFTEVAKAVSDLLAPVPDSHAFVQPGHTNSSLLTAVGPSQKFRLFVGREVGILASALSIGSQLPQPPAAPPDKYPPCVLIRSGTTAAVPGTRQETYTYKSYFRTGTQVPPVRLSCTYSLQASHGESGPPWQTELVLCAGCSSREDKNYFGSALTSLRYMRTRGYCQPALP